MKKSDELKQLRKTKHDAQQAIVDKAKAEKREMTPEEETEFDDLDVEAEGLTRSIERAEKAEKLELTRAARGGETVGGDADAELRELGEIKQRYSLHKAVRSMTVKGESLDGVELEMHQETLRQAKRAGVAIEGVAVPLSFGKPHQKRFAGQSATQDSGAYGGNLVNVDEKEIIEFLRPRPIVESLGARYLTGLEGNLKFPVNNGGITAYWEDEVDTTPESKNAYGSKNMTPKRLGAAVPISLQNLMQSNIDLERYTIDEMNAVLANALDLAAINGSGTGFVPTGILNTSGVNTIAAGTNGAAPTFAQLVAAAVKVRAANANLPGAKMGWLFNPETTGKLETTPKVDGYPTYMMGDDRKVNGYPSFESTLVPNNLTKGTGSNLSAAIFGDFNQLIIGQWGFLDLTIDNISQKRSGYIEVIVNMFADVMVRQPKAFTVIKDWVTV